MPASLYSEPEPALYNTDTEDYDSVYGDFEVGSAQGTPEMDCILLYTTQDCASESDSLLGHNKAKSAPNIATATTTAAAAAATSTAKQMPSSGHNFQLKMLDETLSIGVNQVAARLISTHLHICISTYLHIYTFTYLHIFISTHLLIY